MSKHKAHVPATYVMGASVVLDVNEKTNRVEPVIAKVTMTNKGHGDVPYACAGDPMWRKPKPVSFTMHFKSAAARLRAIAAARVKLDTANGVDSLSFEDRCNTPFPAPTEKQILEASSPKDMKIVPIYRGIPARFANQIRNTNRRKAEAAEEKKRRPIKDRVKDALASVGIKPSDDDLTFAT